MSEIKVSPLPFAVFDEFGKGCDDRVQDYARAAVEADRAQRGEVVGYAFEWSEYGPDDLRGQQWRHDLLFHVPISSSDRVRNLRPLYAIPPATDQLIQRSAAVVRQLVEALEHAVDIAEAKRPGNWDDLLEYRPTITAGRALLDEIGGGV